jgi:hypothetical protein
MADQRCNLCIEFAPFKPAHLDFAARPPRNFRTGNGSGSGAVTMPLRNLRPSGDGASGFAVGMFVLGSVLILLGIGLYIAAVIHELQARRAI